MIVLDMVGQYCAKRKVQPCGIRAVRDEAATSGLARL